MKFLLCFILLLSCYYGVSQYTVSGVLVDETETPVELAEIVIYDSALIPLRSDFSNAKGEFELVLEKGFYKIEARLVGTILFEKEIMLADHTYLGTIKVQTATLLGEVQLVATQKILERKIDRLIFNVQNVPEASGTNALELFEITPRLRVQNNQVKMTGKNSMQVMINGRLLPLKDGDLTAYLTTLSSENIKRIEVISNPPANYSAEGNSGLVNIITKKNVTDAWNITLRNTYRQATYPTIIPGASLNYKRDKFTLAGSIDKNNGSVAPEELSTITYPLINWQEENNRRDLANYITGNLAIDYMLNDRLSMGASGTFIDSKPENLDDITATIVNAETNAIDSLIVTDAKNTIKRKTVALNYHIIQKIDTLGRKLALDVDYFAYKVISNRIFETNTIVDDVPKPSSFASGDNRGKQNIQNFSVNLDMEHPFKKFAFNYGVRIAYTETDNRFRFLDLSSGSPILDDTKSDSFLFLERTQAFYTSANWQVGKSWELKAGLRLESTQTEGNSFTLDQQNKNNYTRLFPSFYIAYKPSDTHFFSLNYGRRINRPGFNSLNPFQWVGSPYSFAEGNPFLQPSFAHNIELEYGYEDLLTTTLYASFLEDGFEQVAIIDPETNVQQIIPQNFLSSKSIGVSQSFNYSLGTWCDLRLFTNLNYSETTSDFPVTLDFLNGWNGDVYISSNFYPLKNKLVSITPSYNYIARGVNYLDTNSSYDQFNITARMLFLNKDLTVTVRANDIFRSNRPTYTSFSNTIKNSFTNYYDLRYLRISVLYRFGKKFKTSSVRQKNREEFSRTN
ncbi:TonB-dependent receptor domain-containing protein [Flavobacteriaceae bacterium M23B6Z8]